jgi:indole-3-glycerol phosphate synthase
LLIAEVLDERLADFVGLTEDLGMEPLVEVRDEDDAESAISAGASLIGINNRDLKTMKVDIENTEKIIDSLPANIVKVSESGIRTRDDVRRVQAAGADGVLVGTSIMGSEDVRGKVGNLIGG